MLLKNALIFLFNKKCFLCGKRKEVIICEKCLVRINRLENYRIIDIKNKNLTRLIYFFKYEKIIRKLILQFKFGDKPYLSKVFGKIIIKNKKFCEKMKFYDIILSVPMHKDKIKARGYNQTELLAIEIANNFDIKYEKEVFIKTLNTRMQSSLTGNERYENIKNAFKVLNREKIKDKKIILIDDIYTTGATLEECAKVLKKAGAKEVCGVVIAKD